MDKAVVAMDFPKVQEAAGALRKQGWEPERVRGHLEKELRARSAQFKDGTEFSIDYVNEFLQFVFQLANDDLCAKVITVQVLQDAFDVSLIQRCQDLFSIVEDNIFKWKSPPYFEVCKNQILRLCNDLLKRLSRTVDTSFCGRILILLAKSLPLSEKSGLNLASQFNVANTTSVEEEKKELGHDEPDEDADENNDMEVGEIRENKDAAIPVDYELYSKFWRLQQYFVNPNSLYDRNKWKNFESDLTEVLGVFSTYKLERTGEKPRTSFSAQADRERPGSSADLNGANGTNGGESPQDNNNDTMDFSRAPVEDDGFFAKYLTNQKLFHLQLADSQFRRYFLVQCLILANYLTSDVKFRDASLSLRPEQENYVKEFTDTCHQLLRETYPHGSQFSEAIRKSLLREKMWSNWKNEGCQDIVTPLLNQKCLPFKRKPLADGGTSKVDLGSTELTRLWNISADNLTACAEADRNCIPQLKQFVEEALDELDPLQEVEDEYKCTNDEKYQWMAGRFLLSTSEQYLQSAVPAGTVQTVPVFLDKAIRKTAAYIPDLKSKADEIEKRIKEAAEKRAEELQRRKAAEEEERRAAAEAEAQAEKAAAEAAKQKKPAEPTSPTKKAESAPLEAAKPAAEVAPKRPADALRAKPKEANDQPAKSTDAVLARVVKEEPPETPAKRQKRDEEPPKRPEPPKKTARVEGPEKPSDPAVPPKKIKLETTTEADTSNAVTGELCDKIAIILNGDPNAGWRKLADVIKPPTNEMETYERPTNAGKIRAIIARILRNWVKAIGGAATTKALSVVLLAADLFTEEVAEAIKKHTSRAPEGNGSAANHSAVENGKAEKQRVEKGNGTAAAPTKSMSELSEVSVKDPASKSKETVEKSSKEAAPERPPKERSERASSASKDRHRSKTPQNGEKEKRDKEKDRTAKDGAKEREKSREQPEKERDRSSADKTTKERPERAEKERDRSERSGSKHDNAPEKSSARRAASPERTKRSDPPSERTKRSAAASPERSARRSERPAVSPPRRAERGVTAVKSRRESR